MRGFDRLHPALQHHVVNSLGWNELRPLQDEAIEPVLAGEHVLALAPTAGGKTEAAMLPLLSRIVTEGWRELSVLYVCPLRALLNNLHPRLERYAGFVGLRAGLWHGDIGAAARGRLFDEPPEILLTTPESLEAILMSARRDHRGFFANLRTVVVDEVHAFGGDDRGWHLLAVLERLSVVAGRDLQRIGLSATVGEPDRLLRWLVGSSNGEARIVAPSMESLAAPDLTLDHVGSLGNAATVISKLHAGQKRLVFCDSRARVEELAVDLRERGVRTFVSHSSLALDERRQAEEAFAEATDCVIVSTSTLELGIDVGDLDRVIQIDSPTTVASFLQRLGRTGRRKGTTRNMLFLTTKAETELVRAAGLLELWSRGYVEPVNGPPSPFHLLAQQVLALVLQEGSIARSRWTEVVARLPVFADAVRSGLAEEILQHLLASEMLFDDGYGILSMGAGGESSYGYRNFLNLTSAFTSSPLFVVRHGAQEIGYLDPISLLTPDRHFATVLLAGRTWTVTAVDWERRFAWVQPAEGGGRSRWLGEGQPLSAPLCDAIRNVLAGVDPPSVSLTTRAATQLEELRKELAWVQPGRTAVVASDSGLTWWTFGGQHANAALMAAMGSLLGGSKVDNLAIKLDADVATADKVRDFVSSTEADTLPAPWIAEELSKKLKFADCLPPAIALNIAAARVSDPSGIQRVLAEQVGRFEGV
ncbi:MAG TPA: DEAD/DEAH box helicase [Acidimicrobiales bacterium]|nr:DEAD/DEAH box helicase [Acidimicrobiales bacterium]